MRKLIFSAVIAICGSASSLAQTQLGSFTFNDNQFGDSLFEFDGGAFSAGNWLNTTNVDPGNPAYLTGVNFETGIANIPFGTGYRIFYNTPIVNGVGDDLGVVVARYSSDDFEFAFTEDGVGWSPGVTILAASGVDSGVSKNYFYNTAGPFNAELFVHPIDLSNYGVLLGNSVVGVEIGGLSQLDLIRVAGFGTVPEPCTLLGFGTLGLVAFARRRIRK
jgi:hypothetical protein